MSPAFTCVELEFKVSQACVSEKVEKILFEEVGGHVGSRHELGLTRMQTKNFAAKVTLLNEFPKTLMMRIAPIETKIPKMFPMYRSVTVCSQVAVGRGPPNHS